VRHRVALNNEPTKDETNMLNYLAAYGATAVVILALHAVWLGVIAKSFYRNGIGHLMADPPNLVAGGVFYLRYPLGVLLFAVAPTAWSEGHAAPADLPWSRAMLAGALRLLCLCHLRPQQPGHAAGLALAPPTGRYRVAHGAHRYSSRCWALGRWGAWPEALWPRSEACVMRVDSKPAIYGAIGANIAISVTKFTSAGILGSSAMLWEGVHRRSGHWDQQGRAEGSRTLPDDQALVHRIRLGASGASADRPGRHPPAGRETGRLVARTRCDSHRGRPATAMTNS